MTAPLYMLQVPINLNELARQAGDRGWIIRRDNKGRESDAGFDEGRALHHVLDEAFGPGRLRPFRLLAPRGKSNGSIYAYTSSTDEELRDAFATSAPPEHARILNVDSLATKAMPSNWTAGRRLGFDVRVRAIVRIKTPLPNPRNPAKPYKEGAELDAFFVEAQRNHPESRPRIVDGEHTSSGMIDAGRTREAVYRDWLAARFKGAAGLDADNTVMHSFERSRLARDGDSTEGPDVIFHGELTIADPTGFAALLAGGVGRHKAYGYGMLLLRHPGRRAPTT
jgi:CRISPR system Cascade subunit CasE